MKPEELIMLVDDEPNVLEGFRRSLGRSYNLLLCSGGPEALAAMGDGPLPAVVVTDMRMPSMNGIEFVKQARRLSPDPVFVMLTGNADQQTAVDAINEGRVFRFLNKPCDQRVLEKTIAASLRQHRLVTAERVLLRETLTASVRVLMDAAIAADPEVERMTAFVRGLVLDLARSMLGEAPWSVSIASSLFGIGYIATAGAEQSSRLREETLVRVAACGGRLVRNIPRMASVAKMIEGQRTPQAVPAHVDLEDEESVARLGASLLRFAIDLYRATAGDAARIAEAVPAVGSAHDARIVKAARELFAREPVAVPASQEDDTCELPIDELRIGDVLVLDVYTREDVLLLRAEQEVTAFVLERLRSFHRASLLKTTAIRVRRRARQGRPSREKRAA